MSVRNVFYGTSQGRNGVLSLLSCVTVNDGSLSACLQFVSPLVSDKEANDSTQNILYLIRNIE